MEDGLNHRRNLTKVDYNALYSVLEIGFSKTSVEQRGKTQ
jgi:hypothetical protein